MGVKKKVKIVKKLPAPKIHKTVMKKIVHKMKPKVAITTLKYTLKIHVAHAKKIVNKFVHTIKPKIVKAHIKMKKISILMKKHAKKAKIAAKLHKKTGKKPNPKK